MLSFPESIPGLPIVPPYREGELIQSHLRRIADANYISCHQMSQILRGQGPQNSKEERLKLVEYLAEKMGHPADQAKSLTVQGYLKLSAGQSSRRQICPECLAQDVTPSVMLAESAYAICPTHGLAHAVKCPGCQKDLLWGLGRRHLCTCRFDLRDSERVKVTQDTLELYLACLENRSLSDLQTSLPIDAPEVRMKRLNTTLEYLSTTCAMGIAQSKLPQNPSVSSAAHLWESIGQKVKANPKRLSDVLIDIEMQLVYTKTIPGRGVLRPEKVRSAISWGYLRNATQSAHQSVIKLERTNDLRQIAEMHGLDPQEVLATQLMVNRCISIDVRAEMRSQFNKLKWQRGVDSELESRRIAALISLVQELRSVHESSWLMRPHGDDKVNLFAFIAAGALSVWAPTPFKNWHVHLSDVVRLSHLLLGQPPPKVQRCETGDSYIVNFPQIFSERADPSDWLGLSSREIASRVEILVRSSEYPTIIPDTPQDRLALPLGFSAFLAGGVISICGDPGEEGGLEMLTLVSESWEAAARELAQVCLRAQANFARLANWQRVAATVAWNYASTIRDSGSAVEAWKTAKAELIAAETFSHKAIRAAIEIWSA